MNGKRYIALFSNSSGEVLHFSFIVLLLVAFALALNYSQNVFGQGGAQDNVNFTFNGTLQNTTYNTMTDVNVSVWTLQTGPETPGVFLASNLTDNHGNFSLSVIPSDTYQMPYTIKIRAQDQDGNATFTNPPYPPFPREMITNMLQEQTIYAVPASTIFVTATNDTQYFANFSGIVMDKKFGMEMDSWFPPSVVYNRSVVVPKGRNYSLVLMRMFDQATQEGTPPLTIDIYDNNLSDYKVFNVTVNISTNERYLTGNISIVDNNVDVNISDVMVFIMGAGMFPLEMPPMNIPDFSLNSFKGFQGYNISSTVLSTGANTSFYNYTIVGASVSIQYVIAAFGYNGTGTDDTGGQYYGYWQNFSATDSDVSFNITLKPLAGEWMQSSGLAFPTNTTKTNISTVYNLSGTMTAATNGGGGILKVKNHNEYGPVVLNAFAVPDATGAVQFALINGSNVTYQMFNKGFAPKETIINLSQSQNQIEIKTFDLREPGSEGSEGGDLVSGNNFIGMYTYNSSCNVQVPDEETCQILNFSHDSSSENTAFNPVKFMMGDLLNIRIIPAVGPSVYMIGVDMLASGPPDFQPPAGMESNATSGASMNQIWKISSFVPSTVFEYSYVGLPYESSLALDKDVNVTLELLYNNNYDIIWNMSEYSSSDTAIDAIPDEFTDFLPTYQCLFNETGKCACSTTDNTQTCYINQTDQRMYLKILHFTGSGPEVEAQDGSTSAPNLSVTLPENASFYNVTNITINFSVSSSFDQCWITNSTGTNGSDTNCTNLENTTLIVGQDAVNEITIGSNDTSGNINRSVIFFTVDNTYPAAISYNSVPTNNSYHNETDFNINISFTETNVNNCWAQNGSTVSSLFYGTLDTSSSYCNITVVMYEDFINFTVFVNDSIGQVNSNETRFLYIDPNRPIIDATLPNESLATATIPVDTNITFNISDAYINTSTLVMENIVITSRDTDVQFNGSVNFSLANASYGTVTIDPYRLFAYNTTFIVNVTMRVRDLAGNNISDHVVFNFTTNESTAPNVSQVIGNASFIDHNFADYLNLTVNGTDIFIAENDTYLVEIKNSTGQSIVDFNFTLNASSSLEVSNITVLKNPNSTHGSVMIKQLELRNHTKVVYIDNLTERTGLCVRDDDNIDDISSFSANCSHPMETWVACPGSNASFTCTYDTTTERYKLWGLSHSAVVQMNDSIPPNVLKKTAPSGTVTSSSTTLTVTSNENATCRYSANSGTSYASMSSSSETSLGTSHSFSLSGLSTGSPDYYVKCKDAYGNTMHKDFTASFTVSISSSTTTTTSGGGSANTKPSSKTLVWSNIAKGQTIDSPVLNSDFPIAHIKFTANDKDFLSNVALSFTERTSKPINTDNITGKVYTYFDVSNNNIAIINLDGGVTYMVRVTREWIADNNLSVDDLVVKRWEALNKTWNELPTSLASEDATYYLFDAQSPGFSYYAIAQSDASVIAMQADEEAPEEEPELVQVVDEATPEEEQSDQPEEEVVEEPVEEQEAEKTNSKWWAWVLLVFVVTALVYVLKYRKQEKEKKPWEDVVSKAEPYQPKNHSLADLNKSSEKTSKKKK